MLCFFFYGYGDHRDLPSFPTRRSSDLFENGTDPNQHITGFLPNSVRPVPLSCRLWARFAFLRDWGGAEAGMAGSTLAWGRSSTPMAG